MLTASPIRTLILLFLLVSLGAVALTACGSDDSGEETATYTIGIVSAGGAFQASIDAFLAALAEEGYREGENLTVLNAGPIGYERADMDAEFERLLAEDVDLLVSVSSPITAAAQAATSEVPVVFFPITDPVGSAFVTNLREPEANLTGVTNGGTSGPRLEWLTRVAPDAQRILAPYNPNDPAPVSQLDVMNETAERLGVELVYVELPTAAATDEFSRNLPEDIDAIFIMSDGLMMTYLDQWTASAIAAGLPLTSLPSMGADGDVLLTYGINQMDTGRQAARLAARLLTGTAVVDVPVERAQFFVTINLQVAEAIGLEVTDDILSQADVIIRPEAAETEQ